MATFQVAAPAPFNFSKPETWHKWIQRFDYNIFIVLLLLR